MKNKRKSIFLISTVLLISFGLSMNGSIAFILDQYDINNNISKDEAINFINTEFSIIMDLRTAGEYEQGHIPSSISFPMPNLGCDSCITKTLLEDKNKIIVVYTQDGENGDIACEMLREQGFEFVLNLKGGYESWISADYPIEKDSDNYNVRFLAGGYPVMQDIPLPIRSDDPEDQPVPTRSFDEIPSSFSWRNYNGDWTSPAKDQASCGSCWAFSAMSIMESSINIASGYPDTDMDLSEQYILSCLPYGGSCGGGWTDDCLASIISTDSGIGNGINGVPLETCMPYQAVDYIPCDDKCPNWNYVNLSNNGVLWQLQNWGANHNFDGDDPDDRAIVKGWILDYGTVSASMYATSGFSNYFNTHHGPNDWYWEEDYPYTNHAVELIGWHDDESVTNGGYWRLKNSWGTDWGNNGYFNVAYGGLTIGTRIRWCTTPEWPNQPTNESPANPIVFADFSIENKYPNPGEEIDFVDESIGAVVLWEWDFNDDGIIDSNSHRPKYTYFNDGVYNVTLTVWSQLGLNHSITKKIEIRSQWPPIAIASPEYYGGNNFEIEFEGRYSTDPDGQVVSYHWDFDDGTTSTEPNPIHVFTQGDTIYDVTLTVTDNEGASSSIVADIRIDITVPPVTTAVISCGTGGSWFNRAASIQLVAEDWTRVAYTMFNVDNSDFKRYNQPVVISDQGEHTIQFYSVDIYGNEESIQTKSVNLDFEKPSLDVQIDGQTSNGWYVTNPIITLIAEDTSSGVETVIYKINDGDWLDYSQPFTLSEGRYLLWCVAVDYAGNTYSTNLIPVNVDTDAPTTHYNLDGIGTNNRFYQSVILTLFSGDEGSGVEKIMHKIGGGSFNEYTQEILFDSIGDYTVEFYAIDNLGNTEEVQSIQFSVSNINFNAEITSPINGLYIRGSYKFPLLRTIILGSIDVIVEVESFIPGVPSDISTVEFYINNDLKDTKTTEPYIFTIDERLFGGKTIKIILNGGQGGNIILETEMIIFHL
jgi:PKD repeat protein/rhodanese-related sulfurtransferase